jgi:hypothetical protein
MKKLTCITTGWAKSREKRIGDKHHQKTLTAVVPSWSVLNLAQSTCKVTRKKHDEIKCIQN